MDACMISMWLGSVMAVTKFRCEWRLSGFAINSLAIKIMIFILCRIPVVVIRDRR